MEVLQIFHIIANLCKFLICGGRGKIINQYICKICQLFAEFTSPSSICKQKQKFILN